MRVAEVVNPREQVVTKLTAQRGRVQIKIEVTPVLRGCVFAPEVRAVSPRVEETFGLVEAPVVSFEDLYAGKIVPALDRQHPRDLFDVRELLANEGIGGELRQAFLVYLISHDRPIGEVLVPRRKDIARAFAQGFDGMTDDPVALDDLLAARETLIETMAGGMPEAHRRFLLGFKAGDPDWELLGVPGAPDLPAVRWKRENLAAARVPEAAGGGT